MKNKIIFIALSIILIVSSVRASSPVSIEPYVQSNDAQAVRRWILNIIVPPQGSNQQNENDKAIQDCEAMKYVDQQMMPVVNNTTPYYFSGFGGTFIDSYKFIIEQEIVGVMAIGSRDFVDGTQELLPVIFLPKQYGDAVIPEVIAHLKKYTNYTEITCCVPFDREDFKAIFEKCGFGYIPEDIPELSRFKFYCDKQNVEIEPYVQSNDEQTVRQWALSMFAPVSENESEENDCGKAIAENKIAKYVDEQLVPVVNDIANYYGDVVDGKFIGSYKIMIGQSIVGVVVLGSQDFGVGKYMKHLDSFGTGKCMQRLDALIFLPDELADAVIPEVIAHLKTYPDGDKITFFVPWDGPDFKTVFEKCGFEDFPGLPKFYFNTRLENGEAVTWGMRSNDFLI